MPDNLMFPKYLSIQTTSFCNAKCVFCPNEETKNLFPPKIMEEALFKKIIAGCAEHKEVERVILYLNNEPLTDPKIISRINYAKENLPWASVHILTNGSLLDEKIQDELIDSKLDWIGISMHGIRKETVRAAMGLDYDAVFPRILKFIEKAKSKRKLEEFLMITFLGHEFLFPEEKDEAIKFWKDRGISRISFFDAPISRAGNVPALAKAHYSEISGCKSIWANEMLHIVENGDAVLCCMDWKREVVLGNLERQSINEVWNSKAYSSARQKRDGKICSEDNFICKRCEEAVEPGEIKVNKGPADIILITVPPWQTKMPPLGLGYLSSFLRARGVSTKIVDLNVTLFNKADKSQKYFWDIDTINSFTPVEIGERFCTAFSQELEDFINRITNLPDQMIGLSTTVASINVAVHIAHRIKQKDRSKIVILGGPGVFWNTQIIDPEKIIDVFVLGEGELPLLEILTRFKKNKSLHDLIGIPATIVCFEKQYYPSGSLNPLRNLDDIPLVELCEFDLSAYNSESESRPLPVLISRGCINRCSFCIDHKMNSPFRARDARNVFNELKYYVEKFGVRDFEFNDLLCNGNLRQLEQICDLIINEKLALRWHSYAAIRQGMTPELLRKMRTSGCMSLCYGMESASDPVLRKMNKAFNSGTAEQVIRDTHNANILTKINIILGHPGESEKEFKETCAFVTRNKDFIDEITNVSTCFLMPETDLIKNPQKFGIYFKKNLKTSLKEFLKKEQSECNYRKFYVLPDNSPTSRARRLRRMIGLILRLKIPYVIVNRVKEDDAGFDKTFAKKECKSLSGISNNLLKVNLDPKIKAAHIYFCGQRITSDVGMNTSFNIEGRWVDSSSARWEIKQEGDQLRAKISFQNLPISQEWFIRLHKETLSWEVKSYFHDDVEVGQQKSGIIFPAGFDEYSVNGSKFDFPAIERDFKDVDFLKASNVELTGPGLPKINLKQKNDDFLQLQNFPFSFYSRIVNFCLVDYSAAAGNEKGRIFKKGGTESDTLKLTLSKK